MKKTVIIVLGLTILFYSMFRIYNFFYDNNQFRNQTLQGEMKGVL